MPKALNLLADQIFAEQPARGPRAMAGGTFGHEYLPSHIFSTVRAGIIDFANDPGRYCDADVSEYVTSGAALGPYERQVLGEILNFPSRLAVVVGSAGSGKSSTIRYVLEHYERHSRSDADLIQHVYIDLNPLQGELLRIEQSKQGSGVHFLFDKMPNRIPDAIIQSLRQRADGGKKPLRLLMELADRAYRWASGEEQPPREFGFATEVRDVGRIPITKDPDADHQVLLARLREREPHDRMIYWFAILDALNMTWSGYRPLLVVVDNVDQLPEYAQAELKTRLLGLSQRGSFKIVMPIRISTFKTIGFALEFNWYPHSGPNASDVVAFRLLSFIRAPERYPAFRAIADKYWRDRAVIRAFDLLLRVTRGRSAFQGIGRLVDAGAGVSIRRALKAARHLFETEDLSFEYDQVEATLSSLSGLVDSLNVMTCVGRLGGALREELIGIAIELGRNGGRRVLEEESRRLADVTADLLRNTLLERSENKGWASARIWSDVDLIASCCRDVADGIHFARWHLQEAEIEADGICGILQGLAQRFVPAVIERAGLGENVEPKLVRLLDEIARCLEGTTHGTEDEVDSGDQRIAWDDGGACRRVLDHNRVHTFTAALVNSGSFANLFRLSEKTNELSELPLLIIFGLAYHAEGKLSLAVMIEDLQARLIPKSQLLEAFNTLASAGHRIIWLDKEFACESFDELCRRNEARLTVGGWGYFNSVLEEIDYVLEMLGPRSNASNRRTEWLGLRLKHALEGLVNLHKRLNTGIPELGGSSREWHAMDGRIAQEVAAKCTDGLLRAVRGHFRVVRGGVGDHLGPELRKKELQQTRDAVVGWATLLAEGAQSNPAVSWRPSHVQRMARARTSGSSPGGIEIALEKVTRALAGDDVWAPQLQTDSFRPERTHP